MRLNSEVDEEILLMLYISSDQYGKVDMPLAKRIAAEHFNLDIGNKQIYFKQRNINRLVKAGILPDVSNIIKKMKFPWPKC